MPAAIAALVMAAAPAWAQQPMPTAVPAHAKKVQVVAGATAGHGDGAMVIATWSDGGEFYAVSFDGVNFSEPRGGDYRIHLRAARFDPLHDPLPVVSDRLSGDGGTQKAFVGPQNSELRTQNSLYIVQFIAPPEEAMLDAVRALGGQPRAYLPQFAHVMELSPAARQQVAGLPFVRWVGPYHAAYKLEESLVAEMATSKQRNLPTRRYSIMLFERGAAAQQAVANQIAGRGGIINARINEGFRIEATLTSEQLLEVAALNQVQFIDQWGPAGVDMNIARQIGGAVPLLDSAGFTGQGVRGEVMDNGILMSHQAFANPAPLVHGIAPVTQPHGTATYGIVFGNGAGNANGTGMLPNREQGIFAMLSNLMGNGGPVTRYAHTAELVDPLGPYRAVFQSNSWGSGPGTTYTTVSAEMDDIVFINDILSCQSQSNNASQISRPEAWAKNNISVGGITHQNTLSRADDTWTAASYGPASDGRIKPDLAHFYDNVTAPSSGGVTDYTTTFNGTSAATPIVCGYAGLVFQMWHEQVFSGFGGGATVFDSRPHTSTIKAMIINSAFRYNWLEGGPNGNLTRAKQGWGMPDLANLYNTRQKTFIVNESDALTPFDSTAYQFEVAAGEPEFRATLAYTDAKGNPASSAAIINDLTLRVTDPNGIVYWGNNGLTAGNYSAPGGAADNRNTVENVFLLNPPAGMWTIEVLADAVVQDAHVETAEMDADYGLVIAGVVIPVPCPADINGDDQINVNDLLAVINAWGPCAGCPEDVNGDGQVNVNDLLAVINGWGPCP